MADDPNNPPAGDPPANDPPAPPADPPADPPAPDEWDKERGMATIKALREKEKEGKAAAKERDALAARLKEYEDADKSELEKAQQRAAELEAKEKQWAAEKRETNLRLAVFEKASELASPGLAIAALQRDGNVTFDDNGQPENLDEALAALLEREPLLRGKAAPKPPPQLDGGGGGGGGEPPALTAEELQAAETAGMSPEEYAALKDVKTLDDFTAAKKNLHAQAT